jgi:predicted nucleic acid-binding protein
MVDTGVITGYSSVITLTEVLTHPLQTNDATVVSEYRSFLLGSQNLFLTPITPAIAEQAAVLRARYHLRTPDALQIAAAVEHSCEAFLTNDSRLRRVNEIRVLVFDDIVDVVPPS